MFTYQPLCVVCHRRNTAIHKRKAAREWGSNKYANFTILFLFHFATRSFSAANGGEARWPMQLLSSMFSPNAHNFVQLHPHVGLLFHFRVPATFFILTARFHFFLCVTLLPATIFSLSSFLFRSLPLLALSSRSVDVARFSHRPSVLLLCTGSSEIVRCVCRFFFLSAACVCALFYFFFFDKRQPKTKTTMTTCVCVLFGAEEYVFGTFLLFAAV